MAGFDSNFGRRHRRVGEDSDRSSPPEGAASESPTDEELTEVADLGWTEGAPRTSDLDPSARTAWVRHADVHATPWEPALAEIGDDSGDETPLEETNGPGEEWSSGPTSRPLLIGVGLLVLLVLLLGGLFAWRFDPVPEQDIVGSSCSLRLKADRRCAELAGVGSLDVARYVIGGGDPDASPSDPRQNTGVVGDAFNSVRAWWEGNHLRYQLAHRPLADRDLLLFDQDSATRRCGVRITYEMVAGNAFAANCPDGSFIIAVDLEFVSENYGVDLPGGRLVQGDVVRMLVAHEFGHIIQMENGLMTELTIINELMADCLAGAFVALDDGAGAGHWDELMDLTISIGDPVGLSPLHDQAHGSSFDRLAAALEGMTHGVPRCLQYESDGPMITSREFADEDDYQRGGDLPFEASIDLMAATGSDFLTELTGVRFTPQDLTAELSEDIQRNLYQIGDVAVGYGIIYHTVASWAVPVGYPDAAARRLAACVAGAWLGYLESGTEYSLSAGDLSEAMFVLRDIGLLGVEPPFDPGRDARTLEELVIGFRSGTDACRSVPSQAG